VVVSAISSPIENTLWLTMGKYSRWWWVQSNSFYPMTLNTKDLKGLCVYPLSLDPSYVCVRYPFRAWRTTGLSWTYFLSLSRVFKWWKSCFKN